MRRTFGAENTPRIVLLLTAILTIPALYYTPYLGQRIFSPSPSPSPSPSLSPSTRPKDTISEKLRVEIDRCDIFKGEWIPNPRAPYYTNETCWAIYDNQNCVKFGRPDTDYTKWRWKPNGCELAIFNPAQFLELVRDKSMAFVGDSVGRNQMQSLMCLLSRVTYPVDISHTSDENFKVWSYPAYNFTLAHFWSPFLVAADEAVQQSSPYLTGLFNVHLDVPDPNWVTQVQSFDYVIISAGHWFFRAAMYFENDLLTGCYYCFQPNVTDLTLYYGYRRAFRTAFSALNAIRGFKGMTIFRTFAPSHFEGGEWNKGGNCLRKRPWRSNEMRLEGVNLEMYMTQLEEYRAAVVMGRKRGLRFRLLDTTEAMLLRPDGHPGAYGHLPGANVTLYNDCVHWCLPGPVDTWNDFLLHMLKMEGGRLGFERV